MNLCSANGEAGNARTSEELVQVVYGELRRIAAHKLRREAPGQTLQATALVHEAWLSLSANPNRQWNDPPHFVRAAAEAMRHILINRARKRQRLRHGGQLQRVRLEDLDLAAPVDDATLLAVDDALGRLAAQAPQPAELVRLRFYGGASIAEAAAALGISPATAKRHWVFARALLFKELSAAG